MINSLETIENLLSNKYEIGTINAAMLNPDRVNVMGTDTIKYNITGHVTEEETSMVRVDARCTLKKIFEIYVEGFEFNIKYRKTIPQIISNIESLIENLYKNKGFNATTTDITLPNSKITLEDVVRFYIEFTKANKVLINKLLIADFKDTVDGLLILDGGENFDKDIRIKTGEAFVNEVSNYSRNNETSGLKNKIIRIRDEY